MATVEVVSEFIDRETRERMLVGVVQEYAAPRATELEKAGFVKRLQQPKPTPAPRGRKPKTEPVADDPVSLDT